MIFVSLEKMSLLLSYFFDHWPKILENDQNKIHINISPIRLIWPKFNFQLCFITSIKIIFALVILIGGRVRFASVIKTVDKGSIPGRIKPKTIKTDIYSFLA